MKIPDGGAARSIKAWSRGVNALSVCSGIGAPECAWGPLGWRFIACSEIDAFPSAVLAYHYPDEPNWGDLGYGWSYRVLDAQYFGVAQRRRRVFVVGCAGDWRSAAAVLFERESLSGHPAPRREARKSSSAATARSVAVRGRDGVPQVELGDPEDGTGRGTPIVANVADTLTAHWERSKGAKAGNQVGVLNPIIYPAAVRRLTPSECERLQGFPVGYTQVTFKGKDPADGSRYKALGNSMAVPVMRWIGQRIADVDLIDAKR